MHNRLTLDALETLLASRFDEGFLTLKDLPHPDTFKDMQKATKRVVDAIEKREKITIVGDYDVDGIVSTTLMIRFFNEIGYDISWVIPNRFKDGYGLSPTIIENIESCDLIITVDNGIAATEAAALCKERGIDLIVTDHHLLPPKLPEAYAIIDQKQPDCDFPYEDICGAQIAWYLIASLKNALGVKIDMVAYMALAAIAIIADVMPLKHINRAMVTTGLQRLSRGEIPAIRAFLESTQKSELRSDDIGFFLAPLLNSAGRMEEASYAVEFLLSTNIYDARVRLERLKSFNQMRKEVENTITKEALLQCNEEDSVIVVSGRSWHEGVVGIVASRIANRFKKPAIVLSENDEGILKGSGRSYGECDLFSLIERSRSLLEKFGGHFAAIGLSIRKENLDDFRLRLQAHFQDAAYITESKDREILGELRFEDISFDLIRLIDRFEPFGEGNPVPKFISKGVRIASVSKMGKEGNHLRFVFEQNGIMHQGVRFKTDESYENGISVDIVYRVNENRFRGDISLQLMIEEIRSSDRRHDEYLSLKE